MNGEYSQETQLMPVDFTREYERLSAPMFLVFQYTYTTMAP